MEDKELEEYFKEQYHDDGAGGSSTAGDG